jgi:hypothetical protein
MLPLEKQTVNYSVAMFLNLWFQIAFRGVLYLHEFNFSVKLKQIFNFLSFTEVYNLHLKNDSLSPTFYVGSTRYLRTKGLCASVRVQKHYCTGKESPFLLSVKIHKHSLWDTRKRGQYRDWVTGWMVRGSNAGRSKEIFSSPISPDPPSPPLNGHRGCLPTVKRPGREVNR